MSAEFVESRPIQKFPVRSARDILEAQYRSGRAVLDRAEWARQAYEELRRRCPHVPEEQLVRLFHDKSQSQLEFVQGSAIFLEYNAKRPLGRRRGRGKRGPSKSPGRRSARAPRARSKASRGKSARRVPRAAARKAAAKAKRRR